MSRRTVLYLQHTFVLGGSAVSLLYLLQQLDRTKYEPVVVCLHDAPEVVAFYRSRGFRTLVVGGRMFSHTTGGWWPLTNPLGIWGLVRWLAQYPVAALRLRKVVREIAPAVVHLNSLTLAPYAPAIRRAGVPVVMHVRESVHPGHFGVRRAALQRLLNACDEVIYICKHDRARLSGGSIGTIVYNFVDFARFDRELDQVESRRALEVDAGATVVLYLGGISGIKGIVPLLRALQTVHDRVPGLICLMPGAAFPPRPTGVGGMLRRAFSALGWRSIAEEEARRIYEAGGMAEYVRLLPFSREVPRLLAAANVVVFPSVEPHFARPVMEAAAMGKLVVASDIGGVNEIVEDGVTGRLVPSGDVPALAGAIEELLLNAGGIATGMGERAYQAARGRFDARANARATVDVYERILSAKG